MRIASRYLPLVSYKGPSSISYYDFIYRWDCYVSNYQKVVEQTLSRKHAVILDSEFKKCYCPVRINAFFDFYSTVFDLNYNHKHNID